MGWDAPKYMRSFVLAIILFSSLSLFGQSGRVGPQEPAAAGDKTVKQLFEEANTYLKTKLTEFEVKKIPFSDNLLKQTQREQKQLAAKYAALAVTRTALAGEDFYYFGLLHWLAENLDGTAENLGKYVALEAKEPEKAQTSRSILTVVLAKQKKLDEAEAMLAEYLKTEPRKPRERARMENEMAKAYIAGSQFAKAAPHADEAYRSTKELVANAASRAKILDELVDAGLLVFESNRDAGNQKETDAVLDDMRALAAELGDPSFFYLAADKKITYMIETGRKPQALETYLVALISAGKDAAAGYAAKRCYRQAKKARKAL